MADWRAKADAFDDGTPAPEPPNQVHLAKTIDGRGELRGRWTPTCTRFLEAGLRVADCGDFELSPGERRADALATVFQHFLDYQDTRTSAAVIVPISTW